MLHKIVTQATLPPPPPQKNYVMKSTGCDPNIFHIRLVLNTS